MCKWNPKWRCPSSDLAIDNAISGPIYWSSPVFLSPLVTLQGFA